ncbi:DUF4350 domain-containing protein [Roseateles sp. SL47]|uniref:DUF4350 domain-containing protein n=1 Tax=Roseateles sp. SL47 TaxID=2995138 RepID=UPI00226F9E6C|nr:DUF4350 domain-containing protein [Roseateles sp. SL47]WAC74815.1 DUF4350 domain-containing protein [Roseateles sp. SL47]
MTRGRWLWALGLVLLGLGAWWISANTVWDERPIYKPPQGEARTNPVYAMEQLLRKLGVQAEHRDTLEALPPPQARLVLMSDDWNLMPERAEQLHAWVKQGGHLVLLTGTSWHDTDLDDWVPIDTHFVNEKSFRPAAAAPTPQAPAASQPSRRGTQDQGEAPSEEDGDDEEDEDSDAMEAPASPVPPVAPAASGAAQEDQPWQPSAVGLKDCHLFSANLRLKQRPDARPIWRVMQGNGAQALRVAVGQGTVTALNVSNSALMRETPLECDNSVLLVASLQAAPGTTVWFYLNEKRESLAPWLWHRGWIAVVLAALALMAALWRKAVRFGPALAVSPRLRRSIGEQVRGLGHYLHRHGSEALMVAQQRALEDTAARRLAHYARLPVPERVRRIAEATGVAEADLASALSARFCTRAELPSRLHVLETARRRLQKTQDERHPQ